MESRERLIGVSRQAVSFVPRCCGTPGVRAQGTGPQISASRAQLRGNPRSHEQAVLANVLLQLQGYGIVLKAAQ